MGVVPTSGYENSDLSLKELSCVPITHGRYRTVLGPTTPILSLILSLVESDESRCTPSLFCSFRNVTLQYVQLPWIYHGPYTIYVSFMYTLLSLHKRYVTIDSMTDPLDSLRRKDLPHRPFSLGLTTHRVDRLYYTLPVVSVFLRWTKYHITLDNC